jgi:hypothetical protein
VADSVWPNRLELSRLGIDRNLIEIHDGVENSSVAHEGVEGLAFLLDLSGAMGIVDCVE